MGRSSYYRGQRYELGPGASVARERDPGRVSDADTAVVMSERSSWEPLGKVAAGAHPAVRTDRTLEAIMADVLTLLDRRLQDGAWLMSNH